MMLYFVKHETAVRLADERSRISSAAVVMGLAYYSDVVVTVDKDDEWLAIKDRHRECGIVPPERRAELLNEYVVIVRPTSAGL